MIKLYSKDGGEAFVKTMSDRKEYLASGFYSEKPFNLDGGRVEDIDVVEESIDIEDAEFVEIEEVSESEEENEESDDGRYEELKALTVAELKEMADGMGLKVRSNAKEDVIIKAIMEAE